MVGCRACQCGTCSHRNDEDFCRRHLMCDGPDDVPVNDPCKRYKKEKICVQCKLNPVEGKAIYCKECAKARHKVFDKACKEKVKRGSPRYVENGGRGPRFKYGG